MVSEDNSDIAPVARGSHERGRSLLRVALVVNQPDGIMVRRAHVFRLQLAGRLAIDVMPAPSRRALLAGIRGADLVYVIDPGRVGFPAAVAARLARRPVIVETGDPQPDLYRALGRSALSVAAGAAIDRLVARYANGVVVRGRGLVQTFRVRVPWVEIPDGVDLEQFRPGIDGSLRDELGIPREALVVGLTGNLGWAKGARLGYGWDIVEALGLLRDEPVWALVVGGGDGIQRLRSRAEELGVFDRLVMPGFLDHTQVPRYVAAMDVCVSTQSNDAIGAGRTTAKLPEYLAADRFVLATAVGAALDVLPDEMLLPYSGSFDAGHPVRLAERIAELVPRRAELRRGAGTRAIAAERFSYPLLAERLAAFVAEVDQ